MGNVAVADVASTVDGLRAQLERMQGRRLEVPVLPVPPALATLLPGGGLRPGASYSLGRSMSLLFALFARELEGFRLQEFSHWVQYARLRACRRTRAPWRAGPESHRTHGSRPQCPGLASW